MGAIWREMAAEAERLAAGGHRGLRLKIGPGSDVDCVGAVRDAVGDDVVLRVDCNQGYSKDGAIKVIRKLEGFDIELVEQPTAWWDFRSLAEVAASVDTPIMPHESMYLMSDVKSLIDMGAVGVLGLKTYRPAGGITNAVRILEMARVMNIPCLMHDDVELGVSLAAACQVIASHQQALTHACELSGFPEWMADDVVEKPIRIEDGFVEVPEGPGLGVELDESKIEKYTGGVMSLRA